MSEAALLQASKFVRLRKFYGQLRAPAHFPGADRVLRSGQNDSGVVGRLEACGVCARFLKQRFKLTNEVKRPAKKRGVVLGVDRSAVTGHPFNGTLAG